jgi:bla regulator protein blaR1
MRYTLSPGEPATVTRKFIFAAFAIFATASATILASARVLCAQSSANEDWEKAAGGKASFDAASVKENKPLGDKAGSNLPFGGDTQPVKESLFTGTAMGLSFYLNVAYKLNISQARSLDSQPPKRAKEERFDIQGSIPPGTTKDKVRLMLQSLLADRFQLKAHFETREMPAFATVLVKPGIAGPNLKPHSDNPPCPDASVPLSWGADENSWTMPNTCGGVIGATTGRTILYAARGVSMQTFAENLPVTPDTDLGRPVVDQTGLVGNFDFLLKYSPQPRDGVKLEPDDFEAAFLEALKDQLGIKLNSVNAPVDLFVIDHIEEPTPN